MLDELEKQVMGEFDYRKEGIQMELVRQNMLCFKKLVKVCVYEQLVHTAVVYTSTCTQMLRCSL